MLADLGAEVIKIEPPRGDPMRRLSRHPAGVNPMWVNSNRGKRSVTLDLKQPEAQAQARDLLASADLMVCNWRRPVAERLGLRDADLVARNPRLIRVYVTGFGPDGPLADAPTYDMIIHGRLGLTEAHGNGTEPADSSFMVDKVSAMLVCQAALAAIAGRELHGVADRVDVAMLDAAAYGNFPDVMANRTFLDHSPESARNMQPDAVRPLATADGWIVVVPVTA
ncbi:MAG TPA: CoA transferase, partial [Ilumatobacteraceae bacterium]|nr:CoA transferase [Ilumatobacteraceae bacterium]